LFGTEMAKEKIRLDQRVQELLPQYSRQQIQSWIMQGKVMVDGLVITKPGTHVTERMNVQINSQEPKYVSRAGFKLEKALDFFKLDVSHFIVLDAGISTGGFTDCLLQRGVRTVYGVDVGYGQVHEKVVRDARVILYERTNLRTFEAVLEPIDLVTLDLSFISVLKVMDVIDRVLRPQGHLIVLIKPQFEAEKKDVGRGGIIKDECVHAKVIETVRAGIIAHGYECIGVIESPLLGGSGNKEFLSYFVKKGT
jgi:23S rRNA (cytidine1920-2'-O)/16S rRNA (cytidine1409-2'-O)-methyltransferase